MSEIIALKIPHTMEEEKYNLLTLCISKNRRRQLTRFIHQEDAYRSLLSELLARSVIKKKLRITNQEIHFERNSYGKPSLMGQPNFHFNISHSGDWVVMIYGEQVVGIDIERIREMELDIVKQFFSEEEYLDIMAKPEPERLEYFFSIWTLKESYIKALGTGLSTPLDTFSICISDEKRIILRPEQSLYGFKQYPFESDYKLSACSFHHPLPTFVQHYPFNELLDDMMKNEAIIYG